MNIKKILKDIKGIEVEVNYKQGYISAKKPDGEGFIFQGDEMDNLVAAYKSSNLYTELWLEQYVAWVVATR